jgi:ATP adenylyltransferase
MDHLFTPWRYAYITGSNAPGDCLFCSLLQPKKDQPKNSQTKDDEEALIVHRAKYCFVVLNAFPYTSGHVMVVPYEHVDELAKLSQPAAGEIMALTQRLETILRELYRPNGINLGMNIGKAAGAGVAGHIHMHILPRWFGDVNFMTAVGETRVLPEDLETTYKKLRSKF